MNDLCSEDIKAYLDLCSGASKILYHLNCEGWIYIGDISGDWNLRIESLTCLKNWTLEDGNQNSLEFFYIPKDIRYILGACNYLVGTEAESWLDNDEWPLGFDIQNDGEGYTISISWKDKDFVSCGATQRAAALKLFHQIWLWINKMEQPSLVNLEGCADIFNEGVMNEPTLEINYANLLQFMQSPFMEYLITAPHNAYSEFLDTKKGWLYLGKVNLIEGEFHVVYKLPLGELRNDLTASLKP